MNKMYEWLVTQYVVTKKGGEKHTLRSRDIGASKLPLFNPFDHVRHYGTCVFEGIRAFWDKRRGKLHIINFDQHIDRLFRSMSALYMIAPDSDSSVIPDEVTRHLKQYNAGEDVFFGKDKRFVKNLIIENLLMNIAEELVTPENDQIYIRPLVTRLDHPGNRLGVHSTTHNISLEVMVQEWPAYLNNPALAVYPDGIVNPLRKHKCGANYGYGGSVKNWATVGLARELGKKFDDALIHDMDDNVDEATGANFFAFYNDTELWTPPTSRCILPGTKRETAIQIARALGITIIEESFKVDSLFSYNHQNQPLYGSAFLTGTATGLEAIHMLYDPTTKKNTIFRPNDVFVEMKRQYNAMIRGENVHDGLKELQQMIVFDHTVEDVNGLKK